MKESSGGFSFGVPPDMDGADDDVDAIEVSGEPITRREATTLGISSMEKTKSTRISGVLPRRDELPSDLSNDLRRMLEQAWAHLKKNETEQALTLAQEVVFEYPSLVAAKIVIARCFINRKEYDKALAILQAIAEPDRNAETLYYIGLCQSRLGRIRDAIVTLRQCRSIASDDALRKRSADLLMHLQGEQTVCPICGKKTLYDSMVDVDDQVVCGNCAKKMTEEEDEEDFDDDDEDDLASGKKRRKRLRPPRTKAEILIRVIFVFFLLGMVAFALYALSIFSPRHYAWVQEKVPYLPPPVHMEDHRPPPMLPQTAPPIAPPVSSIPFDSAMLSHAIAGTEIRHKLVVDGMEDRTGTYGVSFYPEPHGPYRMNSESGDFVWTPDEDDGGKSFEITFSGIFGNLKIRDQVNNLYVSPGPRFTNICSWTTPVPGEITHLVAEDMDNSGGNNLIVVSGEYWSGEIGLFSETRDGYYQLDSRATLSGRPSGAGIIIAGGEKWLTIADYWNSRLRYFALREGNLSEMAVDVDLPGRPILAGFDANSATSAVLCRTERETRLIAYRQEGQLNSVKLGEWFVPDECVWKRILILPGDDEKGLPAMPMVIGNDPRNSIFLFERGDTVPRPVKLPVSGTIVDAALCQDGLVYCLLQNEDKLNLVSFIPARDGRVTAVSTSAAGNAPALGGLVAAKFSDNGGASDILLLSSQALGIAFMSGTGGLGMATFWALEKPARLMGGLVAMPPTAEVPTRLAYMDVDGEIWAVDLATKEE